MVRPNTRNITPRAMPRLRKPSSPTSMLAADRMVKGRIRPEQSFVRYFR